ncbi:hypothetical protein [Mycobacterium deserti]
MTPVDLAKTTVASAMLIAAALPLAGLSAAQPPPPPPAPSAPGVQPPPPVGPPPVPEIAPVYGQGQTPGPFGYIADAWQSFNSANPLDVLTMPQERPIGPPPGAGTGPPLPPGTISLTSPETSTAPLSAGPAPVPGAPAAPGPPVPPPGAAVLPPGPIPPTP